MSPEPSVIRTPSSQVDAGGLADAVEEPGARRSVRRERWRAGGAESSCGDLRQPVARGDAGRQPRGEGGERQAGVGGAGEQREDGEQRVAGRQRREAAAVAAGRGSAEQEAAVRLVADRQPRAFGGERLDGLDDVGRADAGAADPREPARALQRGAGVDRGRHRVGAEGAARSACRRCRRGAPRRSRRRSAAGRRRRRWRPARRGGAPRPRRAIRAASSGGDRLGVDRHEVVGAAERDHLGAEAAERAAVRSRPAALCCVEADAPAGEAAGAEEVDVAGDVARGDAVAGFCGARSGAGRAGASSAARMPASSALVISPSGR